MDAFKYYTYQPTIRQTKKLGFKGVAYRMRRGGVEVVPKGASHYSVLHFYDEVRIDGVECLPHTAIVYEPGASREFGSHHQRWTHSWFHVHGYIAESILSDSGIPTNQPIHVGTAQFIERCVLDLHDEVSQYEEPDTSILQAILTVFAQQIARMTPTHPNRIPQGFLDVRAHIERHYHEPQQLTELAARVALSPSYFGSRFKESFGIAPIDLVIRLRMEEAAIALQDIGRPVSEIARQVGYDDIYHFSKLFKKHHGLSPRLYRKQYLLLSAESRK